MPKNTKIVLKNKKIKKKNISNKIILDKVNRLIEIVENTIIYVQKYKTMDIITAGQVNSCLVQLENLFTKILIIADSVKKVNNITSEHYIINDLQVIIDELAGIFKIFGTKNISDLLYICYGNDYINSNLFNSPKYKIINKYVHPISYKIMHLNTNNSKSNNKVLAKNKIVEDFMIAEHSTTLECFDLARSSANFYTKVYGLKISFQNAEKKNCIIVSAITDDTIVQCLNSNYITEKIVQLKQNKPASNIYSLPDFDRFIDTISFKEMIVYNLKELYHKYKGFHNNNESIRKKNISQIVKEFITSELFKQRSVIIQLLIREQPEFEYMAYLLYDLLSNENNGTIDTFEQTLLFDSLPWCTKKFFRNAMKNTIKYTKNLSSFDENQIPIEQQICLLKASKNIKEKAMIKLKEVKAKSEDTGSKARQYLDGLLKIPFGIYKEEKILCIMKNVNNQFKILLEKIKENDSNINIPMKEHYTHIEMLKYFHYLKNDYFQEIQNKNKEKLINLYTSHKKTKLVNNIGFINKVLKDNDIKNNRISHSGKKNDYMKEKIKNFILKFSNNKVIYDSIASKYQNQLIHNNSKEIDNELKNIDDEWNIVNSSMKSISDTLDKSIHGHKNAKRQIERVIGQWISGKQSGYCFGFEGPPGVGKTSLARKGLAHCLKDEDGQTRPFSFIAMGGATNGSTLSGHNYTYVGSTWGKIVDILMETKCMNPIIFIDELDKISNTEHGKEIIGILTHLVDSTQNEHFQDKYFSGIDLNLNKALFIFSYNNVSIIDKILLDRIHRIKFDVLTLNDKIKITKNYILPEIYEKVNLKDSIDITDDIIKFIIENYTNEAGVRKLKEILFEIISEINLEILQKKKLEIPIVITENLIKEFYLKDKDKIIWKKIHKKPNIGVISGLWANHLGMGGIIPIECVFFPSTNFLDLKLTGMQGDVMKESMNVAKSLAWKLTPDQRKKKIFKEYNSEKFKGIHIHCPEGATPKDGPSAGTAITVCIYSLLNKKKIKNKIAITGEMNLEGCVTAIGGLNLKILGGIRAGVTEFIFPKENQKDFKKFMDSQKEYGNDDIKNIVFHSVEHIDEVLKLVFI